MPETRLWNPHLYNSTHFLSQRFQKHVRFTTALVLGHNGDKTGSQEAGCRNFIVPSKFSIHKLRFYPGKERVSIKMWLFSCSFHFHLVFHNFNISQRSDNIHSPILHGILIRVQLPRIREISTIFWGNEIPSLTIWCIVCFWLWLSKRNRGMRRPHFLARFFSSSKSIGNEVKVVCLVDLGK